MTAAAGVLLADRYRVERSLGQGAFADTVLAIDQRNGRPVAIKVLDPRRVSDLKAFELFDREVSVLSSLRHHSIPAVIDEFRTASPDGPARCLVMEYIEGESLTAIIESGRRLDRASVLRWFLELVGVLDYLHTRVPPVLHRDVKPANIIIRPDGSPALVDFGSVRAVMTPGEGSTVAGTYGYMAYEQYMGQAGPSSDLYGLAATFLHLVTGTPPSGFMSEQGTLAVPDELPCGEPMTGVIRRLLRAAPNERFASAAAVRDALLGGGEVAVATVPRGPSSTGVMRAEPAGLTSGPREIAGEVRTLYQRMAPSTWRWMNGERRSGGVGVAGTFLVGFFSVITAGILPLWFMSLAGGRRRRVRQFLVGGVLARATILEMNPEDVGFEVKLKRVRYQFTVGERLIRGSDLVFTDVAERWLVGEEIEVLYLPDRDFDSVIAST